MSIMQTIIPHRERELEGHELHIVVIVGPSEKRWKRTLKL